MQHAQLEAVRAQREFSETQTRALRQQQWQSQSKTPILGGHVQMDNVEAAKKKRPGLGERMVGRKSHLLPKSLPYRDEIDLAGKIYEHFVIGEGQPVEIGLEKLDFSNHINIHRLFSKKNRDLMLSLPLDKRAARVLSDNMQQPVQVKGNSNRITVIEIKDPAMAVDLDLGLTSDPAKFSVFGRLRLEVKEIDIYINHQNQTVTVEGLLSPLGIERLIDTFNFDPSNRIWYKEALTTIMREGAPPGSTSFNIFARKGSRSEFKRTYTFKEFLQ